MGRQEKPQIERKAKYSGFEKWDIPEIISTNPASKILRMENNIPRYGALIGTKLGEEEFIVSKKYSTLWIRMNRNLDVEDND